MSSKSTNDKVLKSDHVGMKERQTKLKNLSGKVVIF